MEDILRTALNKQLPYAGEVITPKSVICDMINLLWKSIEEAVDPSWSFLDIYCKSVGFLEAIYNMLYYSTDWFEEEHIRKKIEQCKAEHKSGNRSEAEVKYRVDLLNKALESNLHNPENRRKWIFDHMLYGFCITEQIAAICTLELGYFEFNGFTVIKNFRERIRGKKDTKRNITYEKISLGDIKNLFTAQTGRAEMTIDVVVGNPPYNNDMYLDFVFMSHKICKDYTCMITPAKWQAKGGGRNEEFREQIVPYMSNIVYYPDCTDIFRISEYGGICYYLIGKDKVSKKEINNICDKNKLLNSKDIREFRIENTLSNIGQTVVDKISYHNGRLDWLLNNIVTADKKYFLVAPDIIANERGIEGVYQAYGIMSYKTKNCSVIRELRIVENFIPEIDLSTADKVIFTSDSLDECKSLISYTNTKFVRFLIFISISGRTPAYNGNAWRFVPDPGAFDHIFTDKELYKKYNLTQDEINIIESVIKERS